MENDVCLDIAQRINLLKCTGVRITASETFLLEERNSKTNPEAAPLENGAVSHQGAVPGRWQYQMVLHLVLVLHPDLVLHHHMLFMVEGQHFHDRKETRTRMDALVAETKRWTTKAGSGSLDFAKNKTVEVQSVLLAFFEPKIVETIESLDCLVIPGLFLGLQEFERFVQSKSGEGIRKVIFYVTCYSGQA